MFRLIAKALSYLLHPLFLPTFGYAYYFYLLPLSTTPYNEFKDHFVLFIFAVTAVLPGLSFFLLRYFGIISSLEMESREDRHYPMLITAFLNIAILYMMVKSIGMSPDLLFILASSTFALVGATLITYFWKISAHLTGMGGVLGLLLALQTLDPGYKLFYPFLVAILLTGLLGWARLLLDAHNPWQLLAGLLLGAGVSFGTTQYLFTHF